MINSCQLLFYTVLNERTHQISTMECILGVSIRSVNTSICKYLLQICFNCYWKEYIVVHVIIIQYTIHLDYDNSIIYINHNCMTVIEKPTILHNFDYSNSISFVLITRIYWVIMTRKCLWTSKIITLMISLIKVEGFLNRRRTYNFFIWSYFFFTLTFAFRCSYVTKPSILHSLMTLNVDYYFRHGKIIFLHVPLFCGTGYNLLREISIEYSTPFAIFTFNWNYTHFLWMKWQNGEKFGELKNKQNKNLNL